MQNENDPAEMQEKPRDEARCEEEHPWPRAFVLGQENGKSKDGIEPWQFVRGSDRPAYGLV